MGQQRGFQRRIDKVSHHRVFGNPIKRQTHLGFADHAKRRCVDDGCCTIKHVSRLNPVDHFDFPAKFALQTFGPVFGSITDANFGNTGFNKRRQNSTCGTSGPNHCRGTSSWVPIRCPVSQVLDKTISIGVVRKDLSIFPKDQCVRRANQSCTIADDIRNGQDMFFVRNGDVDPDKAKFWQRLERVVQIGRPDFHRYIVAVDPIAAQPVLMQPGGFGVCNRRSDNAGKWNLLGSHAGRVPRKVK